MWTVSDTGILVNLDEVRVVGIEISDDRQFVDVQVRWASTGERFSVVSLIVQEYGDVRMAMEVAKKYIDIIRDHIKSTGHLLELPDVKHRDDLPPPATE